MIGLKKGALYCGVVLAACLSFAGAAGAQILDATGVIYAFTPQQVGSQQGYMLIPMPTNAVRPDMPIQAGVPAAFGLLRNGKPATYGNASVRLTDRDIAAGQVVVNLDPSRRDSFLIVAAETVYTFTQLGVERVVFPGFADEGMTRADIPYAAYTARVPMWQALPPARFYASEIVLPGGDTLEADEFYERLERGERELQGHVRSYLRPDAGVEVWGALNAAHGLGVDPYIDSVASLGASPDPALRMHALSVLSTSSSAAAWEHVVAFMRNDPDPNIQGAAAEALASAPDNSFRFYNVIYRVRAADSATRHAAIQELAASRDERADGELIGLMSAGDGGTALAAVGALATRERWDDLRSALDDDSLSEDTRMAAANALIEGASGELRLSALRYRGFNAVGQGARDALDRIHALGRPDPRPVIEEFLAHPDREMKLHAIALLGQRGDDDAIPALASVAGARGVEPEIRAAAGDAATAILVSRGASEIRSRTSARDEFTRRAAYRALGETANGSSDAFATLRSGLSDRSGQIRGACALGIAAFSTTEALDLVLELETDSDVGVRADVARSLGRFPSEEHADRVNATLVNFLQGGDPEVVAGALLSAGDLRRTSIAGVVVDKIGHPEAIVRAAAMRAAAQLADPANPRAVINALTRGLHDDEIANRVLATTLLGSFNNDLAVIGMSQVLNDSVVEVRHAAIQALGSCGNRGAITPLVSLLEDPNREIRAASLESLAALNMRAAAPDLEAAARRESDPAFATSLVNLAEELTRNGQ